MTIYSCHLSTFNLKYGQNILDKKVGAINGAVKKIMKCLQLIFEAYLPVTILTGRASYGGIAYGFIFSASLFFAAVSFWKFALTRYSSASS